MDKIVLDASAVLAVLQQESGADRVLAAIESLGDAVAISSVNFCEVATKLFKEGATRAEVNFSVDPFQSYVVDFGHTQALRAGELYREPKSLRLSLGDRVCLALAATTGATVWTTDRAWKKLKVGVEIELIRH